MVPFATETQTTDMQICVWDSRSEIVFGNGLAAKEVTSADEPTAVEVASRAKFVKPAAAPVQRQWEVDRETEIFRAVQNNRVQRFPITPVHVHFEIPLRRWAKGDSPRDDLRILES